MNPTQTTSFDWDNKDRLDELKMLLHIFITPSPSHTTFVTPQPSPTTSGTVSRTPSPSPTTSVSPQLSPTTSGTVSRTHSPTTSVTPQPSPTTSGTVSRTPSLSPTTSVTHQTPPVMYSTSPSTPVTLSRSSPTRYPPSIREKREWPPPITPKPWHIRRPPQVGFRRMIRWLELSPPYFIIYSPTGGRRDVMLCIYIHTYIYIYIYIYSLYSYNGLFRTVSIMERSISS